MTQNDLNRAVAACTGESVSEIRHRGFSIADPDDVNHDPEPYGGVFDQELLALDLFDEASGDLDVEDYIIDWDDFQTARNVSIYLTKEDHLAAV